MTESVLIAGAGIGGLTAALRCMPGVSTRLFRAHGPPPIGVGINLLPQAVSDLYALGLGDELARISPWRPRPSPTSTPTARCCSASLAESKGATAIRNIRYTAADYRCCCLPHCETARPNAVHADAQLFHFEESDTSSGYGPRPATSTAAHLSEPTASIRWSARRFHPDDRPPVVVGSADVPRRGRR